jgi:hydrocephalus-inducing protein
VLIAEGYLEELDLVMNAVERFTNRAMVAEETRLRDIDRKRRAKKAAAKEASRPRGRQGAPPDDHEMETPPGPPPGMENWTNPVAIAVQDMRVLQRAMVEVEGDDEPQEKSVMLFDVMPQACQEILPAPLIPTEKPLPPPTTVSVIDPPVERKERNELANFSILTPQPPTPEQWAEYHNAVAEYDAAVAAVEALAANPVPEPKAKAKGAPPPPQVPDEKPSEPQEKDLPDITRWIIDPLSEQRLKVYFSADKVANYSSSLAFEVVGDKGGGAVAINVSGISALPGITSDPRMIFPKCKKRRPQDGYAVKAFVTSLDLYDFGPLLAGRDATARLPTKIHIEEDPDADPDATLKLAEAGSEEPGEESVEQLYQPVSSNVMRHSVDVRIANDSLFPANVKFTLASDPEGDPSSPPSDGSVPFVVEPSNVLLQIGEAQTIKVWCFPADKGVFEDRLVATVEHNPDPVTFGLCALGSVPWASLDLDTVHFGRWMEKIRGDDQFVRLKNESTLPVRWQLICRESEVIDAEPVPVPEGQEPAAEKAIAVPDEFTLDTMSGTLAAGEERNMRIGFRALKAASYRFVLGLEVQDAENFREWQDAGRCEIKAETFAVKVEIEPDPSKNILDFGTVLVGSSVDRTFAVLNKGLYPVRYVLRTRGRALGELLTVEPTEGELPPGESKTISVKCTPMKLFEASNDRDGILLQIFDIQSGEQVDHKVPHMRVGCTAVYNSFQVTPPRGLNFGPVEKDEVRTNQFVLRNVGIFGFDWCLFDPLNPPVYPDNGGPPKIADSQVELGPFTIKPTSGQLNQEGSMEFEVVFKAVGDQDYDCKLGLWVDGVDCSDVLSMATRGRGPATPALATLATPGSTVVPTSTYILTGQSCIPGINTTNLQAIFEEQFFARTLEDAIAIAGRPDVRVFCEIDRIFSFGPVLAHGGHAGSPPASPGAKSTATEDMEASEGVTERLRLTNPKSIPCKVKLDIRKRGGGGDPKDPKKGGAAAPGDDDVFRLNQSEVTLAAHDSAQIEIIFQPPRLASFAAEFVATVEGGTDPNTKELAFELRGDGAVPSVSLQGPPLFGDDGGELKMGTLALGRSHEVRLGLRNDGLLPATVRVEPSPSPHFNVACASSLHLPREGEQFFTIRFQPRQVGPVFGYLSIRTLGNPFEDVQIKLTGEGYQDDVQWDLTEVQSLAEARKRSRAVEPSPSDPALPPAPDHLDLGEVAIGSDAKVKFRLVNSADHLVRFELPETMPDPFGEQLRVVPRTGFVDPHSKAEIALLFEPTQKLQTSPTVDLVCQTFGVTLDPPKEEEDAEPAVDAAEDTGPKEPAFTEIDNTRKEVPLKVSAVTDELALASKVLEGTRGDRPDLTEIHFAPTMMFASKAHRFVLENSSAIGAVCDFEVVGLTASSFVVEPSRCVVGPNGDLEVAVRFSPKEVEHFDCQLVRTLSGVPADQAVTKVGLTGSALRPWCHIELPESDYRTRRQSDTPLDPKYRVIEISSLGTHVKNTKRFYVLNPTSEMISFEWKYMPPKGQDESDDSAFRCITKRGEIRPNKKFEMVFEFAPLTTDTKESFWKFMLLGQKLEEHFLIVGQVEEPRVGMDSPAINFGERLIDGETSEKVRLVNKEIIPFSFSFDPSSYQQEGQAQVVSVSPSSGVVGPDTSLDIEVTFAPTFERSFNFNIVCNVKRKKQPVVLNVKGIGYKIHASLAVEESATSGRRELNAGVAEFLDFGLLQVQESRSFKLYLSNNSKRNFNFRALLQMSPHERPKPIRNCDVPPYLSIADRDDGVAKNHREAEIELTYAPREVHSLEGAVLHIVIPAGTKEEGFKVQLAGGAKRSRVEFSFFEHNFGPCFIARAGTTVAGEPLSGGEESGCEVVNLIATNRDDQDVLLSTTFQREPHLNMTMDDTMIEAGGSRSIPIMFSPMGEKEYDDVIEFLVNDYTKMNVKIRGRGCPMRLELTDLQMQNVDFGITTGGKTVSKTARLVNRSARPINFKLQDENDALRERSVTWHPTHLTVLRPRETVDVEFRFTPMYKIIPFRLPLVAKCDHGVDIRLFQISGTCHATEVRLSEHSVFFGDVVVGSQSSRLVKLHNFGDLGSRFHFEMPARFQGLFSISPMDGFVRPQEEIPLNVSFHPTASRVVEFRRGERTTAQRKSKQILADDKSIDDQITIRDIRCVLDGHPPLTLEASGRSVSQPRESQPLDFLAEVRTKSDNIIKIKNPTDTEWKLRPQVQTTEPAGAVYWTCPYEVTIPAGRDEDVKITYMPLTMTQADDTADPGAAGGSKKREVKHKGTVFIGTPDGKAFLYDLNGTATAPKVDQKIEAKAACKKQHVQKVPVKNWLQERQRFDAKVELIDPAPGSREAQGFSLHAVGTLELPAGIERDYKFNIYAYHEGTAQVRVTLVSRDTGEFVVVDCTIQFYAAESLANIHLEAACRQLARHKIAISNPLDVVAKFKGQSTNTDINFSHDPLEIPPQSERTIELQFRPVQEGRGTADITLKSEELGVYPYTVEWVGTAAGLDRTLVLKAPLGGSIVEEYKFIHYAKQEVTYSASVEAAPGHKGSFGDFQIEPGQDLKKGAADKDGSEVGLAVRFRPSSIGECRAMLVVKGAGGGEYKALLTGFAQPPQPQGPIVVPNAKGEGKAEFRNPFDKPTAFKFQIDNPCFQVAQREKTMDPGEAMQISVFFKSDRAQGGRLIISTDKVSTPWIFFLKGEA